MSKTTKAKKDFEAIKQEEIKRQTAELVAEAKKNQRVLPTYRIEQKDGDAVIWERVILNENYAGMKGVKEFETSNGKIIYYAEKRAKKYSENVVKA